MLKMILALILLAATTSASAVEPSDPSTSPSVGILMQHLDADERRLADWPQLQRYRDANTRLETATAARARVVFMGDSITDNWGRGNDNGVFFPGKPYLNRGVSGQTTAQMLVRFRQDVIALEPRVVVIHAGTNDIAGNTGPSTLGMIEDNLASMVELAHANGIKVVLASLLPVSDYTEYKQIAHRPPPTIRELNAWMKTYAAARHVVYLDYYTAMLDADDALKIDLSGDGLHPNSAGYAVMAPLAQRAIEQALSH